MTRSPADTAAPLVAASPVRRQGRTIVRVGLLVIAALVAVVLGGAGTVDVAHAQTAPSARAASVRLDAQVVAVGDELGFSLEAFPAGAASVALCGGEARVGSSDCDLGRSVVVTVRSDGRAEGSLQVGDTPVPCPCVVRAISVAGGASASTGLVVTGIEGLPGDAGDDALADRPVGVDSSSLVVVSATVVEVDDPGAELTSILGGRTKRTLDLVLANDGPVAVSDPPVSIYLGRDAGGGEVVQPMPIGTLQPGETRRYEVPVELPALGVGRYVVAGHIEGLGQPVVFAADTTTVPWLALALLGFGLIWTAVRTWRGRRILRRTPATEGAVGFPALRALAITAIIGGVAAFAYVAWALDATNGQTAEAQQQLLADLEDQTTEPTLPGAPEQGVAVDPDPGQALGVLRIPSFDGYEFAFVEGVTAEDLTRGPGHFPGTALPGEVGNFVLSGHRTTYAAPFNRLDELQTGDRLVIDTAAGRTTYEVTSSEIVHPSQVEVLEPVSGQPGVAPTEATITLVTCHPEHSAAQRLVVHGRMVATP